MGLGITCITCISCIITCTRGPGGLMLHMLQKWGMVLQELNVGAGEVFVRALKERGMEMTGIGMLDLGDGCVALSTVAREVATQYGPDAVLNFLSMVDRNMGSPEFTVRAAQMFHSKAAESSKRE